jgi:hypothetical protein
LRQHRANRVSTIDRVRAELVKARPPSKDKEAAGGIGSVRGPMSGLPRRSSRAPRTKTS